MADTKISALTAVVTPAGTDEFPVNQGGTSKRLTLAQVDTFVLTAPVFTAGSASANSWPKFTSGTVLTTAEAGALEYDGTVFYGTLEASNRGLNPVYHFCRQNATYTLTSQTAAQKMFNASTNGALTLPVGTYLFECLYHLSAMSATSGNSEFQLGGTATLTDLHMQAFGIDVAAGTVNATSGSWATTATGLATSQHTGSTATVQSSLIKGTFEVSVTGTIIPSIALATAAAAVVGVGSYFMITKIGSTTAATVGNWS